MDFHKEIVKLNNIERTGWKDMHIDGRLESDGEHTFFCTTLALDIINKQKLKLDTEKVLKMLIYHEIGEIDFGDHTPREYLTKEFKHNEEMKGVKRISKLAKNKEILKIWSEFEELKSEEAIFCKKIDKLATIIQSKIYAEKYNRLDIYEEFKNTSIDIYNEFKKFID